MERTVEYKIAWGSDEAVAKEVTEMLLQGWKMQGGVSIHDAGNIIRFAQAMVRVAPSPAQS